MKRKDITIGETYGVVRRLRLRGGSRPQPAKVVGLDGAFKKWRSGGFNGYSETAHTGIRVVFAEDMRIGYEDFEPMSAVRERCTDKYLRELSHAGKVLRAGQEYVLERPGCVVRLWTEIEAEEKEARASMRKHEEQTDDKGDVIEPVVKSILDALALADLKPSDEYRADLKLKLGHGNGVEKKRVTDATFVLSLDGMVKLLGIGVKP